LIDAIEIDGVAVVVVDDDDVDDVDAFDCCDVADDSFFSFSVVVVDVVVAVAVVVVVGGEDDSVGDDALRGDALASSCCCGGRGTAYNVAAEIETHVCTRAWTSTICDIPVATHRRPIEANVRYATFFARPTRRQFAFPKRRCTRPIALPMSKLTENAETPRIHCTTLQHRQHVL
jgi:hypothetical protein